MSLVASKCQVFPGCRFLPGAAALISVPLFSSPVSSIPLALRIASSWSHSEIDSRSPHIDTSTGTHCQPEVGVCHVPAVQRTNRTSSGFRLNTRLTQSIALSDSFALTVIFHTFVASSHLNVPFDSLYPPSIITASFTSATGGFFDGEVVRAFLNTSFKWLVSDNTCTIPRCRLGHP